MAKNKLKTHKGTKKVLNVRNSGSITIGHAGGRHNSGKKTTKTNRNKKQRQLCGKAEQPARQRGGQQQLFRSDCKAERVFQKAQA